jgi:DNA adenine methylase
MVQIEHDDAFAVIKRFDGPDALFYCDPPYVHSTRSAPKGYRHEMGDDKHRELLELINSVKGKVLISCYQSEIYAKALPAKRWRRVARTRDVGPTGKRLEVLYIKK